MNRLSEQYQGAYDLFFEKREEIYELWRTQEGLDPDRLEETLEYLDEFYEILEDPNRIQRDVLDQCYRFGALGGNREAREGDRHSRQLSGQPERYLKTLVPLDQESGG